MQPRIWNISFKIVDQPIKGRWGYVAKYYRKEALQKIKDIFGDYEVKDVKIRKEKS